MDRSVIRPTQLTFIIVIIAVLPLRRIERDAAHAADKATETSGTIGSLRLPAQAEFGPALKASLSGLSTEPAVTTEKLREQVAEFARRHPSERYDLAAGAKALEPGIEPAFRFVRDSIRCESYAGVLRGAQGTLAGRAGNAFDRSLLLADLLQRQGIKTRFARGRLPENEARRLFERIFDAAAETAEQQPDEAASLHSRIRARALRDYAVIHAALDRAFPDGESFSSEQVLAELKEHVWVQANDDGRWIDLDTAFADSTPGKSFCPADSEIVKLPRDAFQFVTLRIIAETLQGTTLNEERLFELSWPASLLIDREISLLHLPGANAGLAGALAGGAQKDLWRPAVMIGRQLFGGKPLAFAEGKEGSGLGKPPKGGLGNLFGKGGALGGSGVLVAEWLEFELDAPGGKPEVIRRALLDRAGAAWRKSKKHEIKDLRPLVRDDQGLCAPREVHLVWLSAGQHNLAAYSRALESWVNPRQPAEKSAPRGRARDHSASVRGALWLYALQGSALLLESDHFLIPALNDRPDCRFYCDSPRIVMISVGPHKGESGMEAAVVIDLRRDRLRGVGRDSNARAALVERKIWYGTLEGALEHELLVSLQRLAPAGTPLVTTSALTKPDETVVLRAAGRNGQANWPRLPETAARARLALDGGNILVVPRSALEKGTLAWWEIAADGDTRAVVEDWNAGLTRFPVYPDHGVPARPGGGLKPPGVIPRDPPDPWPSHLREPGGGPNPTDSGVEWAPGYGPEATEPGGPPPSGDEGDEETGGGKAGSGESEEGGGNEYTAVILTQALPNPLAVLQGFVDKFLVGSAELAVAVSETISKVLSGFLP